MADLQVPPAVGTSGQRLDTIVINVGSTIYRQTIVIGDPSSSGSLANVGSDGRLWVVSGSSGVIQVLTSGTYLVTGTMSLSSGTVTLSSAPLVIVATSGGQLTVTASGVVSLSSGTVTLSSNPTVISASSGVVQVLTSGTLVVNNTSSGTVGTVPSTSVTLSIFNFTASSSNSIQGVAAGAHTIYGWNFGNQASGQQVCVRVYNTTGPTVGSTTNLLFAIPIPGSTGGAGNNYTLPNPGVNSTGGIGFVLVDSFITTSTAIGHNAGDVVGQLYYI
jgi:hypothetical protein